MVCCVTGKIMGLAVYKYTFQVKYTALGYGAGLRAGLKSGWLDQVGRFWH